MRDLKFRAFLKSENCFIYKNFSDLNWYYHETMCKPYRKMKPTDHKTFNIEQFTELKDNNGIGIYEGDIIKITEEGKKIYESDREFMLVGFEDGSFMCATGLDIHDMDGFFSAYSEYVEISGNIHQNKELLEK